jgi:hypothetical protein
MSKAKPSDHETIDAGLDAKAMEAIGRALKAHYQDLVEAPLPERFQELLASLDSTDETSSNRGTDAPG